MEGPSQRSRSEADKIINGAIPVGSCTLQSGTIGASLTGTGDLKKTGSGTLTLSAANSYQGNTIVSGGTLIVGHCDALPSTTSLTISGDACVVLESSLAQAIELTGLVFDLGSSSLAGASSADQSPDVAEDAVALRPESTPAEMVSSELATIAAIDDLVPTVVATLSPAVELPATSDIVLPVSASSTVAVATPTPASSASNQILAVNQVLPAMAIASQVSNAGWPTNGRLVDRNVRPVVCDITCRSSNNGSIPIQTNRRGPCLTGPNMAQSRPATSGIVVPVVVSRPESETERMCFTARTDSAASQVYGLLPLVDTWKGQHSVQTPETVERVSLDRASLWDLMGVSRKRRLAKRPDPGAAATDAILLQGAW